ncbi:MAG: T9SS C-terminal target domain-containing protein, partial [Chitinophagia bacterium]|nr:T9SS C-terminal target domain-containing protein [Chitinophagia bacterium]
YASPGNYSVSLTVSNSTGTVTSNNNFIMSILPATGINNLQEGFENAFPADNWIINNPNADETWEVSPSAATSGIKSLKLRNFTIEAGSTDEFVSTTINTANTDSVVIMYKWAYANMVNGGTSPSYSWSVNGTVLGGASSFTYTPANGDVVSVLATSSFTCASPATVADTAVMTVDLTEDPFVSITAFPGDTSCSGYAVTYTAFWRYGGLTPNLLWKKNGIAVATGPTYTFIPVTGDYVQCVLYSSAPCRTADSAFSNIITMFVGPIHTAYATLSATPGTTIVVGETDTITANVVNGGDTPRYQWVLNGMALAGATNSSYISNAFVDGDTIYCIVYGSDVCATPATFNSNTATIRVLPPNSVGNLNVQGGITLSPNPNEGYFNLNGRLLTDAKEATVEIVNMLGQVVYSSTTELVQGKLNHTVKLGDNISAGAYLIRITAGGTTQTTRFS